MEGQLRVGGAVRCWKAEEEEGLALSGPMMATSPPKGSHKWDPGATSFLVGPSPQIRLRQSFERGRLLSHSHLSSFPFPLTLCPPIAAVEASVPPLRCTATFCLKHSVV